MGRNPQSSIWKCDLATLCFEFNCVLEFNHIVAQRFAWLEVPDDHEIVVGFVPRFTDVSGPRERDAGDVDIVLKQGPLLSSVVAAMNAPSVLTVALHHGATPACVVGFNLFNAWLPAAKQNDGEKHARE